MKKPVKLAAIINEAKKEEAKDLRDNLFLRCRQAIDQMGDGLSGFALVVWDERGDMRTAYNADNGPISFALVPTLVSDALNRHVAVKIVEQQAAEHGQLYFFTNIKAFGAAGMEFLVDEDGRPRGIVMKYPDEVDSEPKLR